MISILIVQSLFMECFSIALIFAISTIAPLLSASLLGKTPNTVELLQKILGTFSS